MRRSSFEHRYGGFVGERRCQRADEGRSGPAVRCRVVLPWLEVGSYPRSDDAVPSNGGV
jgi:hypothetical protein